MLFQEKETLEELIVGTLARRPGLETAEILDRVNKGARSYSKPAVYKELQKLREEGVVLKHHKHHSLHMRWALDMLSFAGNISQNYLKKPSAKSVLPVLPEGKGKTSWHFNDLLQLSDFWGHLILTLVAASRPSYILSWNPHSWTDLTNQEESGEILRLLEPYSIAVYKVVGGDSYLDRLCARAWRKNYIEYSFADSPFKREELPYINVLNDYIITVHLTDRTAKKLDELYDSVESAKDLDIAKIFKVLRSKSKATIRLEKNEEKAGLYRRKFARFFGVRLS